MGAPYRGGGPGNELRTLAQNFYGAGPALDKALKPVFKKASQNIKTDWQTDLRQSDDWAQIAQALSYDDLSDDDGIRFEIGTQKSPSKPGPRPRVRSRRSGRMVYADGNPKDSGGLTHIAMGYTSRGGGHRTDPIRFLETETERLEQYIDAAIVTALSEL